MSPNTNSTPNSTEMIRPDTSRIPEDEDTNVIPFPIVNQLQEAPDFSDVSLRSNEEEIHEDSDPTPPHGIVRNFKKNLRDSEKEFIDNVDAIAEGDERITAEHLERERIERHLAKQATQIVVDIEKIDRDSDIAFRRGKTELLGHKDN